MVRSKSVRADAPGGVAHDDAPVTRREFAKLVAVVQDLERRVTHSREAIDVQFQRLAELQAVVDRVQIAAKKARDHRDGHVD